MQHSARVSAASRQAHAAVAAPPLPRASAAAAARPASRVRRRRRRPAGPPPPHASAEPSALALPEAAPPGGAAGALERAPPGFRAFDLDGVRFLVAEGPGGALRLADAFAIDAETGASTRPAGDAGSLPQGAEAFHEVAWAAEFLGNVFEGREPCTWVHRVYFVALQPRGEGQPDDLPTKLDFTRVYCMDAAARSLERVEVRWLAPPGTDERALRLRIVRGRTALTIDTESSLPGPEEVVSAHHAGVAARSALDKAAGEGEGEGEAAGGAGAGGEGGEAADAALAAPAPADDRGDGDGEEENLRDLAEDFDPDAEEDMDADFDSPAVDY